MRRQWSALVGRLVGVQGFKSEKAAFPWYYKAACGNDPWGLSSLGYAYVQGEGVTEDKPQGIDLIRQAAEADEPWALENYGGRLIKGNGVQQDGAQGLVMLERAAEAGVVSAQASLAWYLASDVYGIPVNDQKSNRYQKLAAEKGNASSQGNLGQALVGGWNGYSKDYVGGAYWSRRAAYHGTAWGVFKMADLYRIGAGVAKNAERAKTLYLKAAEKFQKQADGGRVISYHWLGLMHEKGYGFDANRDKAIEFYLTAARKKHPFSIKKLKRLGVPVPEPEE